MTTRIPGLPGDETRACSETGNLKSGLLRETALKRLQPIAAAALLSGSLMLSGAAMALSPGDTIVHPTTGATLTVLEVVSNGVIVTGDLFVLTTTTVGAIIPDPDDPNLTVEIASVTTNGTTGEIESVTFTDTRTLDVVTPLSTAPSAPPGGTITLAAGAGDVNNLTFIERGSGGGGGRDGALFVSARSGGDGGTGPTINETILASHGAITTVSADLPGIIAASIGGNGGNGGDGYLGANGADGGRGGAGGTVTLTSWVPTISTSGDRSHGVVGQSRSGVGGEGGDGFLSPSGGDGGAGNDGGDVTVTNYSTITTRGVAAHGVFAQSLGGGAGSGGASYGLVGSGGDGNRGGNGGLAEAINYGLITTIGNSSHGVSAQSIGGIGGDAGTSVNLAFSFTSDGAAGGDGGTAIVRARSNGNGTSEVRTEGEASYGLFAQSVGGGGGNGGTGVGLVALGSGGGTGGDGGRAEIYADDGTTVITLQRDSHAIFAQSIGGGGGNGGVTAGAVAVGSRGASGGLGGNVRVETGATVSTGGIDAHGIFAQSVGGGGGSARAAGGLVALGGSGAGAGHAGTVTVTTSSASTINTAEEGSYGIFAQSVGGGGGAGAASGGVVALGGTGGAGGNGSTVIVTNNGGITTDGDLAIGLFAQSVGGGGGNGGSSGGLVTIGGAGAAASTGGNVTVTNAGTITTSGDSSIALQAQSIGGGGGNGGSSGGVFLTVGGSGGGGGGSGLVTVNNSNNLFTDGVEAHGLFAQAVGGGGGNGGSTVSVSAFAGVAIGGAGGEGGDGGVVDVNFSDRTVTVGGVSQTVSPLIQTLQDRSRGVYAQSVGGGGGNGGFAVQVSGGYGVSASIAIGGSGGKGGEGGEVNLDGNVTVRTEGDYSEGIFAQSVGGGGGAGGFATSFSFAAGETAAAAFAVGVGGSGGDGGRGGTVNVNSGGDIVTIGEFSTGFVAQSVGGGGGSGGFSIAVAGSAAGVASASIGVGVGGSGGDGGVGGTVDATYDGTITTSEDHSRGALIQSVGGGGGSGGYNVTGTVALGVGGGVGVGVGVGGSGGDGGTGGTVDGHIGGHVETGGDNATGVTVQSIGGGGGSGGFNVTGSIGAGVIAGGAVAVGVGGAGGGGGDGGVVTASAASITTHGENSGGFLAQSVGGGGGNGGFNVSGSIAGSTGFYGIPGVSVGVAVGVGGAGGDGGIGEAVTANVDGDVYTFGAESDAIVAQSVGGGGGNGGFNVSGSIAASADLTGTSSANVAVGVGVGVGGAGGDGGQAGNVTLDTIGTTVTAGDASDGIIAQSVGGGGGNGGFNVTGNIALSAADAGAAVTVGVSVGGTGGGGGDGQEVRLSVNDGIADPNDTLVAVSTSGIGARGIVAQSVGGGGGNGGFSVTGGISFANTGAGNVGVGVGGGGGDGGDAQLVHGEIYGDVLTGGWGTIAGPNGAADAGGVLVQSVGGGGGNGGFSVAGGISASQSLSGNLMVGVGGFGGDGGSSGEVTGGVTGDVYTSGDRSDAVTYQSLGGGGGNGGFNVTAGISLALNGGAGNLGVGVGGFGGSGGNSEAVEAWVTGDVVTQGHDSHGILFQSVGGGGGNGAFNVTGGISLSSQVSGSLGVGIGGFGGGAGNAGRVDGTLTGDVWTEGDDSFGAMLQSLGGAGGNGGFNVTGNIAFTTGSSVSAAIGVGIGGFAGGGGNADEVVGTVEGLYVTSGDNADGVIAQSLGGGGGNGGFNVSGNIALGNGTTGTASIGIGGFGGAGGTSGDVTLTRLGSTYTDGANSDGVTAQSIAGGGGNGGFNISGGISGSAGGSAASLGFGLGGFGGDGGSAGNVLANVTGNVLARGIEDDTIIAARYDGEGVEVEAERRVRSGGSHGVMVQSVGGGGGNGAFNVTGNISLASPSGGSTSRVLSIGIGGFGGDGGDAGTAELNLAAEAGAADRAQVLANGDDRNAITVQSLGGGGGAGAINVSGSISLDGNITAGVGGFGGAGGLGRAVVADVDADIFASGNNSRGLLAQSIGGGGGHGGINISAGVTANLNNDDSNLTFGLGGFGGAGNRAGTVDVDHVGQILVEGVNSVGLLAQSVGGGGGSGGLNVSATLNTGSADSNTNPLKGYGIAIGIGGAGGAGAVSDDVHVTSLGDIIINGQAVANPAPGADTLEAVAHTGGANGIVVQSIGGGGGQGGMNVSAAVAPQGNPVSVGVGGFGGAGDDAGTVTLIRGYDDPLGTKTAVGGLVRTFGDDSTAIIAQSIGGGGGNAGMNLSFAVSLFNSDGGTAANIAIGGAGGASGAGDTVIVDHYGNIVTDGKNSDGILAQSIGGGGGNASYNLGLGVIKDATAVNLAVGGDTGAGSDGGSVTVDHIGTIVTAGNNSTAIKAQSIGGGGGSAGTDMAMGLLAENSLDIVVGRRGGTGGIGGDVTVNFEGIIDTTGDDSLGIFAQSIGGGGGDSGATSVGVSGSSGSGNDAQTGALSVAVGLEGGTGAAAGDVDVTASVDSSSITTRGDNAHAIHAQSVGGGGGAGGSVANLIGQSNYSLHVGVGGTGGSGGLPGTVTVNSDITLVTEGDGADGILAQSIGGGGGVGGNIFNLGLPLFGSSNIQNQQSVQAVVSVGGSGGQGNTGGTVNVTNTGTIGTTGDTAYGIRAQSIGGGGGDGGAILNLRAESQSNNHTIDINVGGFGDDGGNGGTVDVENYGLIVTTGRDSAGISANSIGGGGGNGGIILDAAVGITGTQQNSHRWVFNIGGFGGTGGDGGSVSVLNQAVAGEANSGTIVTQGDGAYGIFAQSLGGGGGNGSSIISVTGQKADESSSIFGFNLGGSGGSGGVGGAVDVTNDGLIDTSGEGAHGILAQSIGGGGGNGGLVLAANVSIGARAHSPLIAIGGFGGSGGDGGSVEVTNSGNIVTRGANSNGIQAQSIGGGGGNSSIGIAMTGEPISLFASNTLSLILGGAVSSSGGTGGTVTVNHTGDITVLGEGSNAIKAESINGGGGTLEVSFEGIASLPGRPSLPFIGSPLSPDPDQSPADPLLAARTGADGASGMNAGSVTLNLNGTFQAGGNNSTAGLVQSIGGGGGQMSLIASLGITPVALGDTPTPVDVGFTLGGIDGSNNNGGDISASQSGGLLTNGNNSLGLLMQTIGGGGGRGVIDLVSGAGTYLGPVDVRLGGTDGSQETGGSLTRSQSGSVMTTGAFAPAAVLQSIGGGGGFVSVTIDATDQSSHRVRTALGSDGGSNLSGNNIDADFSGGIFTLGDRSVGLFAQSVGAGGGVVQSTGSDRLGVTLGGSDGASGDGGVVAIANTGQIGTTGARSHGVLIQSIGGGGGAVVSDASQIDFGLSADNTGDGGTIAFDQSGDIITEGAGAYGVILQSLGGGGGWIDGIFAGTAGGVGAGGAIDFSVDGMVFSTGADATAVFAQSLGGLGAGDITGLLTGLVRGGDGMGRGVWLDGGANNVVTSSGSISAVSTWAIEATTGNDTILNDGFVFGNVDLGSGVNGFDNRSGAVFVAYNTIDLRDPAPSPQTPQQTQQSAAPAKTPVMDTGTSMTGYSAGGAAAVELVAPFAGSGETGGEKAPVMASLETGSSGLSSIASSGLPVSGKGGPVMDALDTGATGTTGQTGVTALAASPVPEATFRNAGDFLMGLSASPFPIDLLNGETFGNLDGEGDPRFNLYYGARVINTVELDGHYEQTDEGHLVFDIAFGPYASDIVNVTGTATVDGTGDITLTWLENNERKTLFATQEGGFDNGLEISDTLAIDYSIEADAAGVHLVIDTDFGLPSLNRNGRALGGHMDSAVEAGGSAGIGRLLAYLGNMRADDLELYHYVFEELNPEPHLAPFQAQLSSANSFADDLFNCGGPVSRPDDQCVWSQLEMTGRSRDATFENFNVEANSMRFSGGFEQAQGNDWSIAAAMSYENTQPMAVDGQRARTEGEGFSVGIGVERNPAAGPYYGAALSGGWSWWETQRAVNVFEPLVGVSDPETGYVRLGGHVGETFRHGSVFARPQLSASLTALYHNGLAEEGLEGIGVEVLSDKELVGAINPELTVGHVFRETEDMVGTVSVTGGLRLSTQDRLELPVRFLGANPAADPAEIGTSLDQLVYQVGFDIEVAGDDRVGLSIGYDGEFGPETEYQRAGIDLRVRF